ncbi:MAG: MarR family transcriptional regulator [Solobacterium sp.]|jgi:DNA-binding MarR family transcriptional regulator|nr:MarR family transcriptional regulator [Solobacterium sp.]
MEDDRARASLQEYNRLYAEENDIYRKYAKKIGMPEAAFWIMYTLRDSDNALPQKELCQKLALPKQTVNSALKKMETEGVLKLSIETDRRSRLVTLTKKGIRTAEKSVDAVFGWEQEAMNELSENEQKKLIALFRRYRQALRKHLLE